MIGIDWYTNETLGTQMPFVKTVLSKSDTLPYSQLMPCRSLYRFVVAKNRNWNNWFTQDWRVWLWIFRIIYVSETVLFAFGANVILASQHIFGEYRTQNWGETVWKIVTIMRADTAKKFGVTQDIVEKYALFQRCFDFGGRGLFNAI